MRTFTSWGELIDAIHAGYSIFYHAPMDYRPSAVGCVVRKDGKVRVNPIWSGADPFTADIGHLARFRSALMPSPIKAVLVVYTAARDRNGNCYHAAVYTDCASGVSVRFGNIGGESNMRELPSLLGIDRSNVWHDQQVLPIREWQRLTKDWPYIANHADETAARAVCVAIAAGKQI